MNSKIIDSWKKNASEWIKVIQNQDIPSRKFTNKAIEDTLKEINGKKLVDIGCGEGWLTRKMGQSGWDATGLDAIPDLIDDAKNKSNDAFYVFTFEEIIAGKSIPNGPFDVATFNFCLYSKEGMQRLLKNTLTQLNPKGTIVIQTLHPYFLISHDLSYKSQWLQDSWKGLPGNFEDGHSWYARTMEDWIAEIQELNASDFQLSEIVNDKEKPISLIIKISK
ncbi:methyltransferase domain-containing protein [Muricauda sp. JGD-17]|uniref:Methyltransferase domain-containing protein n=1 Tax=Flagellimonas ochracea TaxID=2696472 RepID=A0A964WW73_9FLAO|nr:class I SAM-dependent methyltransferase [Allomuricauda ochracea]NAY90503.1 methyltransferase domain-containing protein [Allomuricauda ochracea]